MELLELKPPHYGVRISGIYVVDDDETTTLAGPFRLRNRSDPMDRPASGYVDLMPFDTRTGQVLIDQTVPV